MLPLISVIYVNFNTSDLLIASVLSLHNLCRGVPFEVIIIDNASEEREKEKLLDWETKEKLYKLRVIYSEKNLGFGKANNLGANCSNAKYLFFLNPDTIIVNDVLTIFYRFLEHSGSNTAACGGNLLKTDHSPNDSYGNFPGFLQELCSIGLGLSKILNTYYYRHVAIAAPARSKDITVVPYIVGADIFLKSEYFKLIGGFDEDFFLYYEETDLFFRLYKYGFKTFLIPDAEIVHFEGASINIPQTGKFNVDKYTMLFRSRLHYYRKWFSRTSVVMFKLIFLLQIIVQFTKGKMGKNPAILFKMFFRNI